MHDSQIPILASGFELEEFDDEILLYSATSTKAIYLNKTAYLVYGMCDSVKTVGEIIALLEKAYPDQRDSIRNDVIAVLTQLQANEMLSFND